MPLDTELHKAAHKGKETLLLSRHCCSIIDEGGDRCVSYSMVPTRLIFGALVGGVYGRHLFRESARERAVGTNIILNRATLHPSIQDGRLRAPTVVRS